MIVSKCRNTSGGHIVVMDLEFNITNKKTIIVAIGSLAEYEQLNTFPFIKHRTKKPKARFYEF